MDSQTSQSKVSHSEEQKNEIHLQYQNSPPDSQKTHSKQNEKDLFLEATGRNPPDEANEQGIAIPTKRDKIMRVDGTSKLKESENGCELVPDIDEQSMLKNLFSKKGENQNQRTQKREKAQMNQEPIQQFEEELSKKIPRLMKEPLYQPKLSMLSNFNDINDEDVLVMNYCEGFNRNNNYESFEQYGSFSSGNCIQTEESDYVSSDLIHDALSDSDC